MCYNCGCHNIQDDMGNSANITVKTFQEMAKKMNASESELKEKLYQYLTGQNTDAAEFEMMITKAAKAWGQSVDEAKKNTLSILKEELKH